MKYLTWFHYLMILVCLGTIIAFVLFIVHPIKASNKVPFTVSQCDQWLADAVEAYGVQQGIYKATLATACYQSLMVPAR